MSAVQQMLMVPSGSLWPGALVHLTANDTGHAAIDWDVADYDVNNWFNAGVNPSRLTVPSGVSLVRYLTAVKSPNTPDQRMLKNGAAFRGRGGATQTTGLFTGTWSAPIAVSAADYFTMTDGVDVTAEDRSWASVAVLDPATRYALVYRSATLSLTAGSTFTLDWDLEVADTDAWHDIVTNPSRLIVPSGVTLVRVSGCIEVSAANAAFLLGPIKNGAAPAGTFLRRQARNATSFLCGMSAPLEVTAGDYFQLQVIASVTARTLSNSEYSWFAIEEVPTTYKRVLAAKSANQSYTSGIEAAVQFDGADTYDTDAMHDPASNNTRLTVPAGATQAQLGFNLLFPSATGNQAARVLKNGGTFAGMPVDTSDVSGADEINGFSAWVNVVPGDYFELMVTTGANLTLAAAVQTWFSLVCR